MLDVGSDWATMDCFKIEKNIITDLEGVFCRNGGFDFDARGV